MRPTPVSRRLVSSSVWLAALLLLSACLLGLSRPASARFSPPTGTPVLTATQGDTSVTLS